MVFKTLLISPMTQWRWLALPLTVFLTGCSVFIDRATSDMADNLSSAILNQDDPKIVRDGAPAYLLLMDSLIEGDPHNASILGAAASLYAAYGIVFVEDEQRSKRLTARAFSYGQRAICEQNESGCGLGDLNFEEFEQALQETRQRDSDALYSFAVSWLAFTRAHSDEWGVLADLPRVELVLLRVQALDPEFETANVDLYLGVLNSLRTPALGGDPEVGRKHFENALAASGGRDLTVKLEFARTYARLMYDRELHDELLKQVLAADPIQPGYTLFNVLAQQEAVGLLADGDDYF